MKMRLRYGVQIHEMCFYGGLSADLVFLEVDAFEEENITRADEYILTTS